MESMRILLLAAGLVISSTGAAAPRPVATAEQAKAIVQAERLGRDIYDLDEAASGATDALMAAMPDPGARGVRGWIVEREPTGTVATFYGSSEGTRRKIFVADMRGRMIARTHVFGAGEDSRLTPVEERMVAAREVALNPATFERLKYRFCEKSLNAVVLPPASPTGPLTIYYLTPQITKDAHPLGGHFRLTIDARGTILDSRPLSRSCITMTPLVPAGGEPAALFITHVLDAQPTEIHVWQSLAAHLPVMVATIPSRQLWRVEEGRITLLSLLP